MLNFNDNELTMEELMEVTDGIKQGKTDEMLDKMSKPELYQFKGAITPEKKLTEEKLDNVNVGQSVLVDEMIAKKFGNL